MVQKKTFGHLMLSVFVAITLTLGCDEKKSPLESTSNNSQANNSNNSSTSPTKSEDETTYDLELDLSTTELGSEEEKLAEKLLRKEPVSFETITKFFVQKHLRRFESLKADEETLPPFSNFWQEIGSLSKKIVEQNDLHKIKIQAEEALGGDILYNKSHSTVVHVIKKKRLQCYSGTSFQQVMLRNHLRRKEFQRKNVVVIYTRGHILFGYVTKDSNREDWILTGIETTAKGKAQVPFGKLKDLHTVGNGAFRVIDAELWMIVHILEKSLRDSNRAMKTLLEQTNKKYGDQMSIKGLEENIEKLFPGSGLSDLEGADADPFSFGQVKVPDGDIPREPKETIPPENYDNPERYSTPVYLEQRMIANVSSHKQSTESRDKDKKAEFVFDELTLEQVEKKITDCGLKETILNWIEKKELCPATIYIEPRGTHSPKFFINIIVQKETQPSENVDLDKLKGAIKKEPLPSNCLGKLSNEIDITLHFDQKTSEEYLAKFSEDETKPKVLTSCEAPSDSIGRINSKSPGATLSLTRGNTSQHKVALTFDGHMEANVADKILNILKEKNLRSTMFLTGTFIQKYTQLVQRMVSDRHEVGSHYLTHPHLVDEYNSGRLTKKQFQFALLQVEKLFSQVAPGHTIAKFWRAPYGEVNDMLIQWASEKGYTHIGWTRSEQGSLDTLDWIADKKHSKYLSPDQMMQEILSFEKKDLHGLRGGIILMHLGAQRIEADQAYQRLPDLLDDFLNLHYQVVPVSELLNEYTI